jgi:hypothetical protein
MGSPQTHKNSGFGASHPVFYKMILKKFLMDVALCNLMC